MRGKAILSKLSADGVKSVTLSTDRGRENECDRSVSMPWYKNVL